VRKNVLVVSSQIPLDFTGPMAELITSVVPHCNSHPSLQYRLGKIFRLCQQRLLAWASYFT
jgi:hypothetical protein